ncbi:Tn3 family transposase [Streptomyces cyaneus]|uniref:LexA family protein n=1 Tax=Streptomyces cyaneus TaxID=1904 RepID=UPI001FE75969|nr:Tn3 family transposase [Streptomyces cyaneus]
MHYAAIRQPTDPEAFITDLKRRMTEALDRLSGALADGSAGGVKVTNRHGEPWIKVPKLERLDESTGLQALKDEVIRRWGVLDLLDVLKNADFLTSFTDEFASVAAYERIDRAVLQRRLLLAPFALGTNMGIRDIVATAEHGETPSMREIARSVGLSSTGSVAYQLDQMAQLGAIDHGPGRGPGRSIALRG